MNTMTHPYSYTSPQSPWQPSLVKLHRIVNMVLHPVLALTLILPLCALLSITASPCMAAGPDHLSLRSFTVAKEQNRVVVRTSVDIEPREAMRALLRDGAQMLLTCTTYLERQRSLLPRSTMATNTAAMVLSYDPLSRQYLLSMALPEDMEQYADMEVSVNTDNTTSQYTQDSQQIQQKPTVSATAQAYGHRDFNSLMDNTLGRLRMPLCSADMLEADEEYFATIRVELRHTKVPPWLSQALFFWSWDVVPSIEFTQAIQGSQP